jgi:hypothetical protein
MDVSILEPKPSRVLGGDVAVFATRYRWLAAIFGVRWTAEDVAELGRNEDTATGDSQWVIREARPGAFDELFFGDSKVWLYTVSSATFHGDSRLGMQTDEFISDTPVRPLAKEQVRVRDELLASPLVFERLPVRTPVRSAVDTSKRYKDPLAMLANPPDSIRGVLPRPKPATKETKQPTAVVTEPEEGHVMCGCFYY